MGTISSLFIFFLQKDFVRTKSKMQTNDSHLLRSFCAQKVVAFVAFVRLFSLCWLMVTGECFLCSKYFL